MESPLGLTTVHWDHEPLPVPRRTKSADKSDALQTLRARGLVSDHAVAFGVRASSAPLSQGRLQFDGRAGSWRASFRLFACIGTMNRPVGTPLVWSSAFRRSGP